MSVFNKSLLEYQILRCYILFLGVPYTYPEAVKSTVKGILQLDTKKYKVLVLSRFKYKM